MLNLASSDRDMRTRAVRVAGAVLAAGCSSRMGRNKLLLEWGGEPLLKHAVRVAAAAGLDPLVVVVGFEADRATDLLTGEPCRLVVNAEHEIGMHSSAAAAAEAVARDAEALIIMLADMPLVTAAMLETIRCKHQSTGAGLIASRYGDVVAPPTLFDHSLFPHLQSMTGGSVKTIVEKFWSEALVVDWHPSLLRDIDTPDDFEALLRTGFEAAE